MLADEDMADDDDTLCYVTSRHVEDDINLSVYDCLTFYLSDTIVQFSVVQ